MMTFQIEPLRPNQGAFLALACAQWDETETYQHFPLHPNMEKYCNLNGAGWHRWYTVRANGKIVGHAGMYLDESMHTGAIIASEDTWFIFKEFRGEGTGSKLLEFVEQDLIKEGVKEIHLTVKGTNPIVGKMVEGKGYLPVATEYMKVIGNVQTERTEAA